MFKEDYTDFELSKKLKEIGFPQWNDNPEEYHPYVEGYDYDGHDTNIFSSNRKLEYSKVPLSLVQKWLREEKRLIIDISYNPYNQDWYYWLYVNNQSDDKETDFNTYDDALSAGIDKSIELLKNMNNV